MLQVMNRRHQLRLGVVLLSVCGIFSLFIRLKSASETVVVELRPVEVESPPIAEVSPIVLESDPDVPPSYEKLREWEQNLPQHDLDLPLPEGKNGRYLFFSSEIQGSGWNNCLNERLMNTYLAYKSKRSYVFKDYMWNTQHCPWPQDKWRNGQVPLTPLNALMSGPTVGGPWDVGDDAPRSVNERYWNVVCPPNERLIIRTGDVKPQVAWKEGDVLFRFWEKLLLEAPERCVDIQGSPGDNLPQTFDLWLWGSTRVLSLWDEFSKSPVSRLLGNSPIVNSAVARNEYLFLPKGPRPAFPVARDPYDRMLAIHIRRGDYKDHCKGLADWNSTFYSWNLLEFLPDRFIHPTGGAEGHNTPENVAEYIRHCYPSIGDILKKTRDVRADYQRQAPLHGGERRTLDVLYVLTNDRTEWLDELKEALRKEQWYTIVTSSELELDQEQKDVGMAIDMEVARKAAVFIGNGWSSFTSNVVHRRLVNGKEASSTRFF